MESRFNVYDFFGYIIPGLVLWGGLLVLAAPSLPAAHLLQSVEPYKYVVSFVAILVAYGTGHLVSQLASLIAERFLIRRWLRYPSENFFHPTPKAPWLFRDYRRSYSEAFALDWKNQYESTFGLPFNHFEAFMNAFHFVKERGLHTLGRLETFLAIYDFSRNSATGLILVSLAATCRWILGGGRWYFLMSAIGLVLSVAFFYRYLKFFRQFGDEVFRTFYVIAKSKRA